MAVKIQNLVHRRGDKFDLPFTLTNIVASQVTAAWFTVRERAPAATVLDDADAVQQVTLAGGGVTFPSATSGRVHIPTFGALFTLSHYVYDLQVAGVDGEPLTLVGGQLTLTPDVTRALSSDYIAPGPNWSDTTSALARREVTLVNGDNNNVLPLGAINRLIGPTAAVTITGFTSDWTDGRDIEFEWFFGKQLTVAHDSSSSLVGNRIICPNGTDVVTPGSATYGTMRIRWADNLSAWILT